MTFFEGIKNTDFNSTKEGSLLDRSLVRKGEIEYSDFQDTLKDMLLFSGEITRDDLEEHFSSQLRLSGEIKFEDIEEEAQKIFALKGLITFNDLAKALQDKFTFTNITEQQLSPSLVIKLNSLYQKDNVLVDCGTFDDIDVEEVLDGGDW